MLWVKSLAIMFVDELGLLSAEFVTTIDSILRYVRKTSELSKPIFQLRKFMKVKPKQAPHCP